MSSMQGFFGNQTEPKPSPGWATRIGQYFDSLFDVKGAQPVPNAEHHMDAVTSSGGQNPLASMPQMWVAKRDRKSMYADIEQMDAEDELVSTALDVYADHTVDFLPDSDVRMRFVAKNPAVQRELDALKDRLDLNSEVWQITRDFKKHGNEFREVVIDRDRMEIVRFKQTVEYHITPNVDEAGDKIHGWIYQKDEDIYTGGGTLLQEWQICHFLFGNRKGTLAVPQLASARKGYKRLAKMEDGMTVARLTRAYDRLAHHVPVKPSHSKEEIWAQLEKYKASITTRRTATSDGQVNQTQNPLDVGTDFYLPEDGTGRGSIEVLTSNNTQLGNLNDVQYHREKLLARLKVPIAFLQIQSSQKTHLKSGSGGSGDVEKQFAKDCKTGQLVLAKGLRRIADMQLLLKGLEPGSYEIELVKIDVKDRKEEADIELTNAQAAAFFVEAFGALPPEFLADRYMNLTSEQRKLMDEFLGQHGKTLTDTKIKTLKNAATKPSPGSGNNNSSKAANSTQQPAGGKKQGLPLDDLVELFTDLVGDFRDELVSQGADLPVLQSDYSDRIRQGLVNIASNTDLPLV